MKPTVHCETCGSRGNSLFHKLEGYALEQMNTFKACNFYRKGQNLFYEESKPLGIFCINQGKIKLYKTGHDGKEQIIRFAQPGDIIGYRALIAEENYSASAMAIEDVVACFIPSEIFMEVLDKHPDISKELMKSLCHELGINSERLQSMAQKSVRQRLAETLLDLIHTFNKEGETGFINVTLPREDLANIVGTATETIIRILADFKDEQLIALEGKKIKILDPRKLKQLVQ